MSHFKDVCECGIMLTQCRCIGPKITNIISPCIHKPAKITTQGGEWSRPTAKPDNNTRPRPAPEEHTTTASNAITDPVTVQSLLRAKKLLESEYGDVPSKFKCSPEVYIYLKENVAKEVLVNGKQVEYYTSIYGIPIEIDITMKPNEWKFE